MQPSRFVTASVPVIGGNSNPGALAMAASVPMRVLVDNVGPVQCFLAFAAADVCNSDGTPTAATYRLPAGVDRVFVLAPKQTLYALAAGAGGILSVAMSDAIPSDTSLA